VRGEKRVAPGVVRIIVGAAVAGTLCAPLPCPAATVCVGPSCGDCTTISRGIGRAAEGDTVLVAPGVYTGVENTQIDFRGRNVVLMSEQGPELTVIDASNARAFHFHTGESSASVVDGFTVRDGSTQGEPGAGFLIENASPTIRNCVIEDCFAMWNSYQAHGHGGGVYLSSSSSEISGCTFSNNGASNDGGAIWSDGPAVEIRDCVFVGNHAGNYGGALQFVDAVAPLVSGCVFINNIGAAEVWSFSACVYCLRSPAAIRDCTFAGNVTDDHGGTLCFEDSQGTVYNSIISYTETGRAISVRLGRAAPTVLHCVSFENDGGDDLGSGAVDNLFEDPLFCGVESGDVTLCANSPCLPEGNVWSEAIGACDAGCGSCDSPVVMTSWGTIKALYQ